MAFAYAQLSVHVLSGAQQINFAREQLDNFGCQVLMRVNRGILILVKSLPHHQMRGSRGPQVGETGGNRWETGVLWLQVEKTGGNLYLDMESATESEVSGIRGGTATLFA